MPYSAELYAALFAYLSVKSFLYDSIFATPQKFVLFIAPILVGSFKFGIPFPAVISQVIVTFSVYNLLLKVVLPTIDKMKTLRRNSKMPVRKRALSKPNQDSNEAILHFSMPKPRIMRVYCSLPIMIGLVSSIIMIALTSTTKNIPWTWTSFTCIYFLMYVLLIAASLFTLVLSPPVALLGAHLSSPSISTMMLVLGYCDLRKIVLIALNSAFLFSGKVYLALSLMNKGGQLISYNLDNKGAWELMDACFFFCMPLHSFLFIAVSYPFGLLSCLRAGSRAKLLTRHSSIIVESSPKICDAVLSLLFIESFQLGGAYCASYGVIAFVVYLLFLMHIVSFKK